MSLIQLETTVSDNSPRGGKIILRTSPTPAAPIYDISVGGITIKNVKLDELFEFVSPQEFEKFEHQRFRGEIEIAEAKARERAIVNRRPGRHRKLGRDVSQPGSSSEQTAVQSSADDDENDDVPIGLASAVVASGRHGRPRPSYSHLYLKQRARQAQRGGLSRAAFKERRALATPQELTEETTSLALAEKPKRRRLTSVSRSDSREEASPSRSEDLSPPALKSEVAAAQHPGPVTASPTRQSLVGPPPAPVMSSDASSIVSSSSEMELAQSAPIHRVSVTSTAEADHNVAMAEASQSLSESEEGGFEIDTILSHHLSDPRTHPPEFGKTPVMLYQVKWVGYDEVTWEPEESFDGAGVPDEYWAERGGEAARRDAMMQGKDKRRSRPPTDR